MPEWFSPEWWANTAIQVLVMLAAYVLGRYVAGRKWAAAPVVLSLSPEAAVIISTQLRDQARNNVGEWIDAGRVGLMPRVRAEVRASDGHVTIESAGNLTSPRQV